MVRGQWCGSKGRSTVSTSRERHGSFRRGVGAVRGNKKEVPNVLELPCC